MKCEFLGPHDPRWSDFLSRVPHQFHHLPGHADLWARHDRGHAEAVLITSGESYFFLPYTLQSLAAFDASPGGRPCWDLRSAYGYPGPLLRAESAGFLQAALRIWHRAMRDRAVVSGFVRLDPLVVYPNEELAAYGRLCLRGETVSVDLEQSEPALWKQIRPAVRKNIAQAQRAGLQVRSHRTEQRHEQFRSMYHQTMDRVRANLNYYYSREHFQALVALLGQAVSISSTETSAGEPLSMGMFISYRGIVQHYLQGTSPSGLSQHAAKLMVHTAILTARRNGDRVFHLGGGRGATADSLFFFKSAFSKRRHRFCTWHLAFWPEVYRRLATERSRIAAAPMSNYFPEYRSQGSCS